MDIASKEQVTWKSRDAWLCILALIFFEFALGVCLDSVARSSLTFSHWWASSFGRGVIYTFQDALWIFVASWFSRSKSVRDFFEPAGLQRRTSLFGWCAAWLAIAIALIDGYGGSKGWTASSQRVVYATLSVPWCFFALSAILIAPFCEEVVTRGFLYRAFRGRYNPMTATIIIICFSAYFHRSSVLRSSFTFVCLASLWILLCIVREKTHSLWDCLLCHAAYNAVGSHFLKGTVVVMLLFLPFVAYPILERRRSKPRRFNVDV